MSASSKGVRTFLQYYYDVLEEVQPLISPAEFSVFTVIYRDIIGYETEHRTQVTMSLPMLETRTGISQRQLKRVIKSLLKKGYIILCDTLGRCGTYVYTLAKRFFTWPEKVPLEPLKESSGDNMSRDTTTLVQHPLPGSGDNMSRLVVTKCPVYPGQNGTTTRDNMSPPTTRQPAPEEARDEPKETLKEKKEIYKEREFIEEEEKEPEENYEPQAPEWQSVLEKIKQQVSPGAFGSWFRGSRAFKRDDQFIVQVESSFHKRHMQNHAKLIRSLLEPMLPASMDIFIATADELAPAKASA